MDVHGLQDDGQGSVGLSRDIVQGLSSMDASQLPHDLLSVLLRAQQGFPMEQRQAEALTRGSWSQSEDDYLLNAVNRFGAKKWTDVAKCVPNRSSKQCRERWYNRLSPNVKHDPFEPWEDDLIVTKQKELGNRWSVIARQLSGRSPNAIKNRWYSGLRGQREPLAQISLVAMGGDLMHQSHLHSEILPPPSELNISIQGDGHSADL